VLTVGAKPLVDIAQVIGLLKVYLLEIVFLLWRKISNGYLKCLHDT
jgi:hypothetical protein